MYSGVSLAALSMDPYNYVCLDFGRSVWSKQTAAESPLDWFINAISVNAIR